MIIFCKYFFLEFLSTRVCGESDGSGKIDEDS